MKNSNSTMAAVLGLAFALLPNAVRAQDWPQWRGPDRDAKAVGFTAPKTWPKELIKKWKVSVGDGVATPALVGDKLYVFSRQSGNEVVRCLDAATNKEIWSDKYPAAGASGPAAGFSGPRASPAVVDGKVVTLGTNATLSCLDAATGKKLWRKDEFKSTPQFQVASSPIVVDGLAVIQYGGRGGGGIVAYDLATGAEKWKWSGDGAAYASPSLLKIGDTKVIVAETEAKIVGVNAADGKLLWETPYAVGGGAGGKGKGGGGGRGYNAASPMVDGETVFCVGSGRGVKAVKLEKSDKGLEGKQVWSNSDNSVIYNTPVIKNGLIYGLSSSGSLFCIKAADGKTAWSSSIDSRQGYGSIVDAGAVLFALTPKSQLVVFEPSEKEFKEVAKYKVADSDVYAYPVVAGNRVFVKDKDSVILWTIE